MEIGAPNGFIVGVAAAQCLAFIVLLVRLAPGARRAPPIPPLPEGLCDTTVTVILPTLNEAARIGPCLAGLARQGPPLTEILVVDSDSTDRTRGIVRAAAAADARIRLLTDPPLPDGWIGKVWALQHGLGFAAGEWVLGVDADIDPEPGFVAAVIAAARRERLDVVSFAPRFAGQTAGERWLHPSLLVTLVYRFGAPEPSPPPERVMANGQCFLARRELLSAQGGYAAARSSWADDVTLARFLGRRGARVGFLDGSRLYRVRSYRSLREMWREWGRSIDLSDASTPVAQWLDILHLVLVQGIPIPVLLFLALRSPEAPEWQLTTLLWVNVTLVVVRLMLLFGLTGAYERRGWAYWVSPTADPLAVLRVVLSTVRRPRHWRGRLYRFR
jgi:dolichol-phosphate mannosyltransferase